MDNNIMELLELADEDSSVTEYSSNGDIKTITIVKNLKQMFCPVCGSRLHSKGTFKRHPNNQSFQGGYTLQITLIGRRWVCSNPDCDYTETDQFRFIERYKHCTTFNDLAILREMKDIHLTCRQIAERYRVSDTYVHSIFMRYVSLPRLTLPSIISIDEVYLNISSKCKYALVIMDWVRGDIVDILPSRRKGTTSEYFYHIPKKERDNVKYLICDMYDPYVNYTKTYFVNACVVTDSFHVVSWLLRLIRSYINSIKKKYQERDRKALQEKNNRSKTAYEKTKDSKEVYILKNGAWVILKNEKNMGEYKGRKYNHFLRMYMDRYDWEREFMALDENFARIKFYKDLYESFNDSYINDFEGASKRLDELIDLYTDCSIKIFRDFAKLLSEYHDSIVNSFKYITVAETDRYERNLRRLSNGPIESFNNIPSSFRYQSHGVSAFEFVRNRILWSLRDDAAILAVPRSEKEIHNYTGRKRGHYKKHE